MEAAKKTLEAARANLAAAVKRIEVDPPATADLDAAHVAVGAFKDAIDFGAGQEPADLDYAKAALSSRKELREKRDYVDARRAKVHIFNHRRTIDAAVAALKEKAKAADAKDPAPTAFEDARAAAKAVKKAADEGRPFGPQDPAFASYLADVDATVAKVEKAVDERWALLEGDKHRARVEEAREALSKAMTGLSAKSTDPEFRTAESAASVLTQKLDEGKVLESKDKGYGAYATKTRGELAAAKKKTDELWSSTGPERLKAEIEPAAKDLAAAAKAVRARKPTPEQLDEARTAAIVVRKLIEKFAPEAKRNVTFGQYVEGVKGTLVEVEGLLQLRALDGALRDVKQAMQKLERRAPSDDDFAVASSTLLVLEKTLEPMNGRDPALSKEVGDAKLWQKDAKALITKRRTELDVAKQQGEVDKLRATTIKLIDGFARPNSGEDDVKDAEAAVKVIAAQLEKGAELTKRDREYAAFDREVKKRIAEFEKKIAAKRLSLVVAAARQEATDALAGAKAKIDAARQPASTDADLDAATKSVESAMALIDSKPDLEKNVPGFASAMERARMDVMKRMEALELARQEREVRKKTIDALTPALAAAGAAANSQDLRVQKTQYEKAFSLFKACKEEGTRALEGNPTFGRLAVVIEGRPGTVKETVAACSQQADVTAPLIKPLASLIAFDEGPKRAYETATALLSKGKKQEALAQFDECTATGLMVQQRSPELKERAFQVGGGQKTLVELTRECTAQGKQLRGK